MSDKPFYSNGERVQPGWDKPAATGSGEPHGYVGSSGLCGRCGHGITHWTHSKQAQMLPTPPASQPTVTLGLIRGFDNLQRWEFFYRSEQLPEGMSPRPDGKWVKYEDVLALLEARV